MTDTPDAPDTTAENPEPEVRRPFLLGAGLPGLIAVAVVAVVVLAYAVATVNNRASKSRSDIGQDATPIMPSTSWSFLDAVPDHAAVQREVGADALYQNTWSSPEEYSTCTTAFGVLSFPDTAPTRFRSDVYAGDTGQVRVQMSVADFDTAEQASAAVDRLAKVAGACEQPVPNASGDVSWTQTESVVGDGFGMDITYTETRLDPAGRSLCAYRVNAVESAVLAVSTCAADAGTSRRATANLFAQMVTAVYARA